MINLTLKVALIFSLVMIPLYSYEQSDKINMDYPPQLQQFKIDLQQSPQNRYTEVATIHKQSIIDFMEYLYQNTYKYRIAFTIGQLLEPIIQHIITDQQFYLQCKSIARVIQKPVARVIVFNFMYQLGAYHDFCTAISVGNQGKQNASGSRFMGRNLDYGYQKYLKDNTVILNYSSKGKVILKTVGHAGLIGCHTGMRINQNDMSSNYAVSLNQRVQGGLHNTLWHMILRAGHTAPYLLIKTLKNNPQASQASKILSSSQTFAPVYYIVASNQTTTLIQKSRKSSQAIFNFKNFTYIVQTNTDRQLPDPDTRRDIAQHKLEQVITNKNGIIQQQDVKTILSQYPNKNKLTLITCILDFTNGKIKAKVWDGNQA